MLCPAWSRVRAGAAFLPLVIFCFEGSQYRDCCFAAAASQQGHTQELLIPLADAIQHRWPGAGPLGPVSLRPTHLVATCNRMYDGKANGLKRLLGTDAKSAH